MDAVAISTDNVLHAEVRQFYRFCYPLNSGRCMTWLQALLSTPERSKSAAESPGGGKASPADPLLQRLPQEKLREVILKCVVIRKTCVCEIHQHGMYAKIRSS